MKKINKLVLVLSKVIEVLHWFAVAAMGLLLGGALFRPELAEELWKEGRIADAEVYGFSMAGAGKGYPGLWPVVLGIAAGVVILSLMAMVFRNAHLILKKSGQSTPFQPDIIRMLREIGIFYLSIPLIGLAISTLVRLLAGVDGVELSVDLGSAMTGLLVLCLTQFFAHGMELERDLDGLM